MVRISRRVTTWMLHEVNSHRHISESELAARRRRCLVSVGVRLGKWIFEMHSTTRWRRGEPPGRRWQDRLRESWNSIRRIRKVGAKARTPITTSAWRSLIGRRAMLAWPQVLCNWPERRLGRSPGRSGQGRCSVAGATISPLRRSFWRISTRSMRSLAVTRHANPGS